MKTFKGKFFPEYFYKYIIFRDSQQGLVLQLGG